MAFAKVFQIYKSITASRKFVTTYVFARSDWFLEWARNQARAPNSSAANHCALLAGVVGDMWSVPLSAQTARIKTVLAFLTSIIQ